jgi:hypothetical protein
MSKTTPEENEVWRCILYDYFKEHYELYLRKTKRGWEAGRGELVVEEDAVDPLTRIIDADGNIG